MTSDLQGHRRFDMRQSCTRAYGELKTHLMKMRRSQTESGQMAVLMTGHDREEIITLKDNQIADLEGQLQEDLKAQLEIRNDRGKIETPGSCCLRRRRKSEHSCPQ